MITHERDIDDLIERYLLHEMTGEEEEEWEAHYFECRECFRRLKRMESIRLGLTARALSEPERAPQRSETRPRWHFGAWFRSPAFAFSAAAVIVLLIPSAVLWQRSRELDREIAALRQPAPLVAAYVLQEGVRRAEVSTVEVTPGAPVLLQFALVGVGDTASLDEDVDEGVAAEIVEAATSRVLWRRTDLRGQGPYQTYAIVLPGGFLDPGGYQVIVRSRRSGREAVFPFQVGIRGR